MSDNKNFKTRQDSIRVDINDPSEVEWLHQKFPDQRHAAIREAIRKAGPYRKAILTYLRAKSVNKK